MFAIVLINKKQYLVSPKDVIHVLHLDGEVGSEKTFTDVLLLSDDKGKTKIGKPTLKGASVKAKIVFQGKGEKIEVRRYKQKVRYRKANGFRPTITKLEIISIA